MQRRTLRLVIGALTAFVVASGFEVGVTRRGASASVARAAPPVTTGAPQECPVAIPSRVAPVSLTVPATATLLSARAPAEARQAYATLPLAFVADTDPSLSGTRFRATGAGFAFAFNDTAAVLSFRDVATWHTVNLRPVDPAPGAVLRARGPRTGTVNSFVGSEHRTGLAAYQEIAYEEVWPGIDLVFRGRGANLKYELHVAPGADPRQIRLAYEGAGAVTLEPDGGLRLDTASGALRDPPPRTFQEIDDERRPVASRFVLDADRGFGFDVGTYDRTRPLVIDPGPRYSTHLGGTSNDFAIDIAVDRQGNAYLTGQTISPDFPVAEGAPDPVHGGAADAFVAKLDPSGSKLVYATYLGGSGAEAGLSIAVDDDGLAYVSGGTSSDDFPTTPGAFDTTHEFNEDVWVAKLSRDGSRLLYSTILSGTGIAGDFGAEIAVDDRGHAFVAGGSGSPDFPLTEGTFGPTHTGEVNVLDAFVTKLEPDGSGLVWSTKIGGTCNDAVTGIAVDGEGDVYVSGSTVSADYPVTEGAHRERYAGEEDAFVTKLAADGERLLYSTYLGGGGFDKAQALELDDDGRAYVTGWTSSRDYPTSRRAPVPDHSGDEDGFVTKLDPTGEFLVYSTYLGGAGADRGHGIAVDDGGNAYVTGHTASRDFPTRRAKAAALAGADDVFVTKVNAAGSRFDYSTYLGGVALDWGRAVAVDSDRNAYVGGRTESPDFPTTTGVVASTSSGGRDAFVVKLDARGR